MSEVAEKTGRKSRAEWVELMPAQFALSQGQYSIDFLGHRVNE